MSPEAISPYSDRPIRPLPKRRLLERLSPDFVKKIKYPLGPRIKPPLFCHPYSSRDETASDPSESQKSNEQNITDESEKNHQSRRNSGDYFGKDDDMPCKSWIFTRQSTEISSKTYQCTEKPEPKNFKPQPPGSIASSAEEYDSFENTNNKKKRKIPTPGESNLNGTRIAGETVGNNSSDDLIEDFLHQSPSSLQGVSGSSRGRYGRNGNCRSPLRTLSETSSNWNNMRTYKQRQSQWTSSPEATGIISRSIANAHAEKNLVSSSQEHENISLHHQATKKTSPAFSQFTFSCDNHVPGWPGSSSSLTLNRNPLSARMSTHATQTSPNMPSSRSVAYPKEIHTSQPYPSSRLKPAQDQTAPLKKTRRRTGKDYLLAARQRRYQQGYQNYHNPVAAEDIWICEFCEYERIFGTPPEALIRQYEIKDKRARKQEAERRRLLEKAKMKGRKGKKGTKSSTKSTPNHDRSSHTNSQNISYPSTDRPQPQNQAHGNEGDEYFKDDCDDTVHLLQDPHPQPIALSSNIPRAGNLAPNIGIHAGSRIDVGNDRFITA